MAISNLKEGRRKTQSRALSQFTLCIDIFDEVTVGLVVNEMGFWAKIYQI